MSPITCGSPPWPQILGNQMAVIQKNAPVLSKSCPQNQNQNLAKITQRKNPYSTKYLFCAHYSALSEISVNFSILLFVHFVTFDFRLPLTTTLQAVSRLRAERHRGQLHVKRQTRATGDNYSGIPQIIPAYAFMPSINKLTAKSGELGSPVSCPHPL